LLQRIFRETLSHHLFKIQQAEVVYTIDRASSGAHAHKTTRETTKTKEVSTTNYTSSCSMHRSYSLQSRVSVTTDSSLLSRSTRECSWPVSQVMRCSNKKNSIYAPPSDDNLRKATLPWRQRYSSTSHIMMYNDKLPESITQPHKIQIYWSS
jgi:hypothetical protein